MPASARSLRLTDAYRDRMLSLRRVAVSAARTLWVLNPDDLDVSFAAWLARTELLLARVQADAVHLSEAYVAAYVASELGARPRPVTVDARAYTGTALDGRPLRAVLAASVFTVKRALGDGRPFAQASEMGRARAVRNVTTELDGAADRALDEALGREGRIVGWRRATGGGACGACLGAATGAIQPTARVLARHAHCRCTKEPVVAGAPERVHRPTGAELFDRLSKADQDALFAGRGGEAKAELLRSGKVSLSDLVQVEAQAEPGRPPTITEAPLQALPTRG